MAGRAVFTSEIPATIGTHIVGEYQSVALFTSADSTPLKNAITPKLARFLAISTIYCYSLEEWAGPEGDPLWCKTKVRGKSGAS